MRVLWITNIVFPEAEKLINGTGGLKSSGGWMLGAAESLIKDPAIKLAVSTPTTLVEELTVVPGEKMGGDQKKDPTSHQ